jgi:chemotaxis protein methyltransferase CheR
MPRNTNIEFREQPILDFVQQRTGLYFRSVQHAHAVTAIERAMRRAGTNNPMDYVARLEVDLAALDELVVELVVGETYFFRFPEQFECLADTVLPELTARTDQDRVMRFWSAGCATGEEAYSMAIVLREAGLLGQSHILATDISKPALEHARRAVYQEWALRGDGSRRVEPHATCGDGSHHLAAEIRDAVHFAHVNLAFDVYPSLVTGTGHQDVIFCRNVLIYLAPAVIPRVASSLFNCLAPGGWLFTAASDPPLDQDAPFETVDTPGGVYYRRPLESPAAKKSRSWQSGPAEMEPSLQTTAVRPDADVTPATMVELARQALLAGQYDRAAELTATCTNLEEASCLHVKALANSDTDLAQAACERILAEHPLSVELHYLHAVLLMEQRRDQQALTAIKRVLFLDRSQVIAHLTLGALLRRIGDLPGAYRAFRNTLDLCQTEDGTCHVPLTEDESFGSVEGAACSQLASLDALTEATE